MDTIDTFESRVNLEEERGKLKQKFAQLMNDDLLFEEGKKEEIRGKRQARLHGTKRELQKIVNNFFY